jgi:hypothetical protein
MPPDADKVEDPPGQMVAGEAVAVKAGPLFTTMVTLAAALLQPIELPITL